MKEKFHPKWLDSFSVNGQSIFLAWHVHNTRYEYTRTDDGWTFGFTRSLETDDDNPIDVIITTVFDDCDQVRDWDNRVAFIERLMYYVTWVCLCNLVTQKSGGQDSCVTVAF